MNRSMPTPSAAAAVLPEEVSRHIDGEGEVDLIIQRQVRDAAWGCPRRSLPEEFVDRVHTALEYAIAHQGFDEHEACCRRTRTSEWLDSLRHGNAYEEWTDRLFRPKKHTAAEVVEKAAAERRAEALLRSMLTPAQRKEFKRRDYFHVVVGDWRFRITRGRSHNVKEVDSRSRLLRSFCAHPEEMVPDADTMLSQKLCLETCPEEFLKLANVMRVRRLRNRPVPPAVLERANARARQAIEVGRAQRQREEAAAREETRQAEETMAVFERAALDVASGVQPESQQPTEAIQAA